MIVYAVVASNVSISALFVAGVVPGIVSGLPIMGVALVVSRRKGYGGDHGQIDGQVRRPALVTTWRALASMLLVVFVLGGILSGWCTPIFLPVAVGIGLVPVHFGMILIANFFIGLCTPPVGTCLFLGCSVGRSNIARVSVEMLPLYAAMFIGLVLATYRPALSLWLPKLLGVME